MKSVEGPLEINPGSETSESGENSVKQEIAFINFPEIRKIKKETDEEQINKDNNQDGEEGWLEEPETSYVVDTNSTNENILEQQQKLFEDNLVNFKSSLENLKKNENSQLLGSFKRDGRDVVFQIRKNDKNELIFNCIDLIGTPISQPHLEESTGLFAPFTNIIKSIADSITGREEANSFLSKSTSFAPNYIQDLLQNFAEKNGLIVKEVNTTNQIQPSIEGKANIKITAANTNAYNHFIAVDILYGLADGSLSVNDNSQLTDKEGKVLKNLSLEQFQDLGQELARQLQQINQQEISKEEVQTQKSEQQSSKQTQATNSSSSYPINLNPAKILKLISLGAGFSFYRNLFNFAADGQIVPIAKPVSPPTPAPINLSPPTFVPSVNPSSGPTTTPTTNPSESPTTNPSESPTLTPSDKPSSGPTTTPTTNPSESPTLTPSSPPTSSPSTTPTTNPSESPTLTPSSPPTSSPST
ncbi:MAG: hypothetical protein SFV53_01485, partial [Rickettsiales bacterium]|nr:hypothetical protein [Rickettsiales bacterium]